MLVPKVKRQKALRQGVFDHLFHTHHTKRVIDRETTNEHIDN